MPLVQVTVSAQTVVVQVQLILVGSHQAGYVHVGTNQGLAIWGLADIVQDSVMVPAG
jgi:hypothetical protein